MAPPDPIPLVTFVNSRSGGQQGIKILEKIKKYVPQDHIFDLSQGGPSPGLLKYKGTRFRILVCGGDGTVGWVLSEIDKQKFPAELTPPIAILPIGTGNDLSRTLKWGGGYSGRGLRSHINQVEKACVVMMDKWRVTAEPLADQPPAQALPPVPPYMNNYFSVGSDAEIALQFHELRTAHPERFTSRVQNLAWYVRLGLAHKPEHVRGAIEVVVDGAAVDVPEKARTVVVLNLPSYAGGSNPWGPYKSSHKKRGLASPAIDDGLFEVVALNGPMQIAAIHANVARGKKLAQGREVKITLKKAIASQVDGEPWKQPPSVITIQHAGTSVMLANSPPNAPHLPFHEHVPAAVAAAATVRVSSERAPRPSAQGLVREGSDSAVFVSPSMRAVLQRTRSSSAPIVHTPSPLKYGPTDPARRKKGRIYCDGCGVEFFLPHLLSNHTKSGLCPNGPGPSDSGKEGRAMSVQSHDGMSSSRELDDEWRTHSADHVRKIEISNGSHHSVDEEEEEKDGAGSGKGKEKVKDKEEAKDGAGKEEDGAGGEPSEPAKATEPANATEPTKAAEPANVEPSEPAKAAEPTHHAEPSEPEKAEEPTTEQEKQPETTEPTKTEEEKEKANHVDRAEKKPADEPTPPPSDEHSSPDEAAAHDHLSSSPSSPPSDTPQQPITTATE